MERKQQIYAALKPKAKSFGFTKKELMSVAALIDDDLELPDDAKDEEVANAIDERTDAVVPLLKFGQSYASRIIDASKNTTGHGTDDGKGEHGTDDGVNDGGDSEAMKLLKTLSERFEKIEGELSAIKTGKTAETRKARLEKEIKDTGVFGQRILRNFERMSFNDEDDFEEFMTSVKDDLKAYNKERTDKGLEALGVIPSGGQSKEGDHKSEELDDAAIDKLVESIN